ANSPLLLISSSSASRPIVRPSSPSTEARSTATRRMLSRVRAPLARRSGSAAVLGKASPLRARYRTNLHPAQLYFNRSVNNSTNVRFCVLPFPAVRRCPDEETAERFASNPFSPAPIPCPAEDVPLQSCDKLPVIEVS